MHLTYAVVHTPAGWSVFEDGLVVHSFEDKAEAAEVGHLLTMGAKAAGGSAKLLVQSDCGRLEPWDLDHALNRLDVIFADSRRRAAPASAQDAG